ncbi:type I methionyl aminopeptidase [Cohnella mopanensis]|uniref:type I methionyl aminopeptidase n=1 Tax=Cohnella mopanensis TaxID=2911966 RepID=UPI001EF94100
MESNDNGRTRASRIPIRTEDEIRRMAAAGRLAGQLRRELGKRIKPGIATMELDRFADNYLIERGASAAQKGYYGYPYAICTAVNECVCHGMPSGRVLQNGDLVTVDFVVELDGWLADTAWTFPVGRITNEARELRNSAYLAMMSGILQARAGRTIGDIAAAVGRISDKGSYGVVSQFGGHGIGRSMHEPPEVPFVGAARTGTRLKQGMVITIEPILTIGSPEVYITEDGWSVVTVEGGIAAQFEHTVAITSEGAVVLTP